MKNNLTIVSIFAILLSVAFLGCKKEYENSQSGRSLTIRMADIPASGKNKNANARIISEKLGISNYGFLVFDSDEAFESYGDFVANSNYAEVQKYHDEISFSSLYKSKYWENNSDKGITEVDQLRYTLNADGIVQMNGVVMKPIENNRFLLTVAVENLTEDVYIRLAAGEFVKEVMNKIATNRPYEKDIDLFEFVKNTPSGYEDTEPFLEPQGIFWGTKCEEHFQIVRNAQTGGFDTLKGTLCCKYRFWINAGCKWK